MNYYPFNVGDYAAHTGHLEPMEDLIYRRLLDAYYLRESPLPADVMLTAKLIRLRSMAADVEAVLREFFQLTEDGWRHLRCDKEIEKMQDKQAKARDAAQQSVKARKANAERTLQKIPTDAEQNLPKQQTNVELPTPTPTPTPREKENPLPPTGVGATDPPAGPSPKVHEFPPGFDRFWQAYPRKTAKPQAAKAFARLRPDEPLLLRMLAALALQRQSAQWQRDDGQFIPHPSTWLNGRRWEDEGSQTDDAFAGAV
jgi:uncharacterized protein YdaU (DUF1376 family)